MIRQSSIFVLCTLLSFGFSGCSDAQPPKQHAEHRSGLAEIGDSNWLTAQDDVKPEVWLVEYEARHGAKRLTSDASAVRRSLIEASQKFNDSPRMIANRAVQLEGMLVEEGGSETAIVLISKLNGAVAPGRIESFGAAGQQYYNMRKAGFSGEQAIEALAKLYGSRS